MSLSKIAVLLGENPVLRFAPSPNGRPTLGHLKGLVLLNQLKQLTGGTLHLRFDDTNPRENYTQENYRSVLGLVDELGIKLDGISRCSDDLKKYEDIAKRLVVEGKAYYCDCTSINLGGICPCSEGTPKNPTCIRVNNYVILRTIDGVWYPTIALQGPIDDYELRTTLVIRGRDLESLRIRQNEISNLVYGKPYPQCEYWGRVKLYRKDGKVWEISKSLLGSSTRFPSLGFFKTWGVPMGCLSQFVKAYGFTKNDIKLDLARLSYYLVHYARRNNYTRINGSWGYLRGKYFLDYENWKIIKLR